MLCLQTYFSIELRKEKAACQITDPDDILLCEVAQSRETTYRFFWDREIELEFSNLRHNHHATMILIKKMDDDIKRQNANKPDQADEQRDSETREKHENMDTEQLNPPLVVLQPTTRKTKRRHKNRNVPYQLRSNKIH